MVQFGDFGLSLVFDHVVMSDCACTFSGLFAEDDGTACGGHEFALFLDTSGMTFGATSVWVRVCW